MLARRAKLVAVRTRLGQLKRWLVRPQPYSLHWLRREGLFSMGPHSYTEPTVRYHAGDEPVRVVVGDWSSLAQGVEIVPGGNHRIDPVASFPIRRVLGLPGFEDDGQPWSKGDVVIGSDVWLGHGVRVLGGVTIGHGAIVGAWSTVTSDIPPYGVAVGVPARVIRLRFDTATIEALLRIAWWNWDVATVRLRAPELASTNVAAFIAKYDTGWV
jgi:acetyltransferase-like isoleucine patch superfamily enzyme